MKRKKTKDLFANWDRVSGLLMKAEHWLLLFDLDGTLAAITSTPEQTTLASSVRSHLRRLAARPYCFVGVISGRSVAQARRLVRLPALTYVGNHGLEIQNSGWSFVHPKANSVIPVLERLEKRLKNECRMVPGVYLENKSLTLSVHYRRVKAPLVGPFLNHLRRWWKTLPETSHFELRQGKKVLEIRPLVHWNKGSAVIWLKRFAPAKALILYAGDDETDEDAFKVLRPTDISIHVGSKRSSQARFSLRRQTDIASLLERLMTMRNGGLHG